MILTLDKIIAAVRRKEIGAISVGTSVFDDNQRGLERGVLQLMRQFKYGPATFVLADIVVRELRCHMMADAAGSLAALKKGLKQVAAPWRLPPAEKDGIYEQVKRGQTAEQIVRERLDEYIAATGATVVSAAEYADHGEAADRFFGPKPPFGNREAKKWEFPYALALLSLEDWCERTGTKMLIVSDDGDWQTFAAQSEHLAVHPDLGEALTCFQEEAATIATGVIKRLIAGGDPRGFVAHIVNAVRSAAGDFEVEVDGDSQFRFEQDISEVKLEDIELDTFRLEPVDYADNYLVVEVKVVAMAQITTYFDFFAGDPIDTVELSLGGGKAFDVQQVDITALVTFVGKVPDERVIEQVDVMPIHLSVEHHDLEPDWDQ